MIHIGTIRIKGSINTCVNERSSSIKVLYEISNNTMQDYFFDIYELQSNFEIRNSIDQIIRPIKLVEAVVKIDTSKYLIDHRYILIKANSIDTFGVETPQFQSYSLEPGKKYSFISRYSRHKKIKINNIPVYNSTIEIEPIKFVVCNN
jgi:hypothetical protein